MEYFSDKEQGTKPRTQELITEPTWGGIVALVRSLIASGAMGHSFPEVCPDNGGIIGTDDQAFGLALKAEVPGISWPLQPNLITDNSLHRKIPFEETLAALDLIQFCYIHVAEPIPAGYHSYFNHHHLVFNVEEGREHFRDTINRIFSRNSLAFGLKPDGVIIRLAPPVFHDLLMSSYFNTGDHELDRMLGEACRKFLDKDPKIRREALERLWDSWERLKSIKNPTNKKMSVAQLLDDAASEPNFRILLEEEAKKLTDIGNTFQIRHSEISQIKIQEIHQIDYLFCRLLSKIFMLVKII